MADDAAEPDVKPAEHGPVYASTVETMERFGVLDTPEAATALTLAKRLDTYVPDRSDSGLASLGKSHLSAMTAARALASSPKDGVSDLLSEIGSKNGK